MLARVGSFLRVLVECRVHMLPFWLLRLRLEGQRKVMKKVGVKIDPCVSIWILEGVHFFPLWAFSSNNCTGADPPPD